MDRLFTSLNGYLKKRKSIFLILLALLIIAAAFKSRGIQLEENLNAIIPEDQRISQISAAFDKSELADQVVFIFSLEDSLAIDPDLLISTADRLAEVLESEEALVTEIRFRMGSEAMLDLYNYIFQNLPFFLDEADYLELQDRITGEAIEKTIEKDFKSLISPAGMATGKFILKDPLHITPLALSKLDRFRLDDNFILYNSAVFTRDKKNLLFFLDPVFPGSNTKENLRLIKHIDEAIDHLKPGKEGVVVQYYGGTAVAVANSVRVKKDILLTLTIALVFFLLIFLAFFRRVRVILVMFLPVLIGALFSLALLSWIYGEVSAIALGVGVIFIGITVDYSLHLFTHIRAGGSVAETVGRISTPVIMSSLTTASAFLCLTIIHSKAMNQIGVFAAFAVVISALSVLIVIPLLLRGNPLGRTKAKTRLGSLIERAVAYPFEKNRWLIIFVFLSSILFGFTSRSIRFNGDISTLNYQSEDLDASESKLKSISSVANSSVYLVTRGTSLDDALEKLQRNRSLIESCREKGLITELSWVPELIPTREAQEEKIARWNQFWDEAGREEVENVIRTNGMKFHFTPDAFDSFYGLIHRDFTPRAPKHFNLLKNLFLDNYISEEDGSISVVSILKAETGMKDQLFEMISTSEDFIIFDNQFFINQFFDVLKDDFNHLVLISMIVVFAILLLFFGRIEIALITFIPIIISWMWTLGLMGMFRIEINIFNIIISTFIFGLGIDYCIFIMNGIIANHREGHHSLVPYKLSILLSAFTTIAAIGVLIFARHPALKSIAVVSIFGISTVVLISYTLLPLFFNFLVRSSGKERMQPLTLFRIISSLVTFILFLGCAFVVTLFLPVFLILPLRRSFKKGLISQIIYLFSAFIVGIGFFIKKRYIHRELLDFSKPSVIVANHQSQLDLVLMLQLNPKMIVLVNKWVWNNIFYGSIIRFADYYPVYKGLDYNFEKLKRKVEQGYSILAFPEGRRSPDGTIKRFHQGALGIADKLGLEIQPVLVHGAYHCLPKTEHFLNTGTITLKCYPRFKAEATEYEDVKTYRDQAKALTAFYRGEYEKLSARVEDPAYLRSRLISRYLYKGPVLEWYLRIKIRMEKDYRFFDEIIPREARIVDLGCGYGFLALMLGMLSEKRKILGIDYDEKKIATASQASLMEENLSFIRADISTDEIPSAEIYILNDVLHYLPADLQLSVLHRCMDEIKEEGMILIRDADSELKKRTWITRFTEWQSTRIFRFNKTRYRLEYLPGKTFEAEAKKMGLGYSRYDHSKFTSNIIHVLKKQKGSINGGQ